jgi:cysteine-rich repeat protein
MGCRAGVIAILIVACSVCGCESDAVCGNGVVEGSEECDDGRNAISSDGCTDDCRFSCHDAWGDPSQCFDLTDDCLQTRCVPGGFGQVCETTNSVGQCPYAGCDRGGAGAGLGVCEDGICVCPGAPCSFPNGRPCAVGQFCWSGPDGGCYLSYCMEDTGEIAAAGCGCVDSGDADPGPTPAGAPFECDPAHCDPAHLESSDPYMCCNEWRTVHADHTMDCVRLEHCAPIPCDARFDDACPWDWVCDATAGTCRAP